jgi:hypothetical protein
MSRIVKLLEKVIPQNAPNRNKPPPSFMKPLPYVYTDEVEVEYKEGLLISELDFRGIHKDGLNKASSFLATIIIGDVDFTLQLKDRYSVLTAIQNHLMNNDPRFEILQEYREIMLRNIYFWESANIKNLRVQQVFDYHLKMNGIQENFDKQLALEIRKAKSKKMKNFVRLKLEEVKKNEEAEATNYLGEVYHRLGTRVLAIPSRFKRDSRMANAIVTERAVLQSGSRAIRERAGDVLKVVFSHDELN